MHKMLDQSRNYLTTKTFSNLTAEPYMDVHTQVTLKRTQTCILNVDKSQFIRVCLNLI